MTYLYNMINTFNMIIYRCLVVYRLTYDNFHGLSIDVTFV